MIEFTMTVVLCLSLSVAARGAVGDGPEAGARMESPLLSADVGEESVLLENAEGAYGRRLLSGVPLESGWVDWADELADGGPRGYWLTGGFSYHMREPVSSRFTGAGALSFSFAALIPHPKAPFVATFDLEFGRYEDPLVAGEEYETTAAMFSIATWVEKSFPVYVGAGVGVIGYKLPSDPGDSGIGLATQLFAGFTFPVGRFDGGVEYQYFWGNAEGAVFDGGGFGFKVGTRF